MCGLVGVFTAKDNGFSNEDIRILEESLIFNQLRGDDSTGAVCISNKDEWSYIKSLGGYKNFIRHTDFGRFRTGILNKGRMVFGHGRAATRGSVKLENAHPFLIKREESSVLFVHNGTLENYQPYPDFYKYDVDSEFLGAMIAEHGAEKALSEVNGAIACMWWDTEDHTFNFYHNKDRPLCFMKTKTGEFYLNSEQWVLEYLNWKFKLGVPEKQIYPIEEMAWHKVPLNGEEAGKYYITHIKRAKNVHNYYPATKHSHGYGYSYGYGEDRDNITHLNMPPLPAEDKEFWDRTIDVIEWIEGTKVITYRDKKVVCEVDSTPPEPGLLRMYELRLSGDVTKVYQTDGNAAPLYVTVKFAVWKEEKKKRLDKERDIGRTADREGKIEGSDISCVRFSTRHRVTKKKIKHYGEILKNSVKPHLQYYRNSCDGDITLGKTVNVELLFCEDRDIKHTSYPYETKMTKAVCAELKPTQDSYIDFVFYTDMSKAEVMAARIFRGTIGGITLSDEAEQTETGAVVVCSLYNVEILNEAEEINAPIVAAGTIH